MKKPSLDRIKKMTAGYIPGEFRDEILRLIEYIESRGQVRTEEEIRERRTQWLMGELPTPAGGPKTARIQELEWVLEDSDPKPDKAQGTDIVKRLRYSYVKADTKVFEDAAKEIERLRGTNKSDSKTEHFLCPRCDTVWQNEDNMLNWCCPPGEPDPKPIEKLGYSVNRHTNKQMDIIIKLNEIIDRFEETRREYGQVTSLMRGSRLIEKIDREGKLIDIQPHTEILDKQDAIIDRLNEIAKE